jgi:polysaccharide biosynthesis protein PslH
VKVLFLLPSVPEPADAGAKIRNRGLLGLAGAEHTVDAVAFGCAEAQARLAGLARRALVVPPPPARGPVQRAAGVLGSPLPDMACRLWSPAYGEVVRELLATERYDAVQAEGIELARYLPLGARPATPWPPPQGRESSFPARDPERPPAGEAVGPRPWCVYDAHNAEFLLQRRAFERAGEAGRPGALLAAAYSALQWRRLARFEADVVARSDLVLAVSQHDANQLEALAAPRTSVAVVPNGLELAAYPFREPAPDDPPNLLFLGTLGYRPNAEAAGWLVRRVLPALFARRPNARLFVVGARPPAWLVRAGQHDDRIAATGPVPDERPYLARCAALVLPHAVGGGSRLKALVALAGGLPIVSTGLGMEGLEAEPDAHYLRAEGAAEMVESLDRLLGDVELRRRLARQGRALVERCYDWSRIAPALRAAYATLGRRASGPPRR